MLQNEKVIRTEKNAEFRDVDRDIDTDKPKGFAVFVGCAEKGFW